MLIKCFFSAQTNAKMGTNCWTTVCFLNVLSRNYSWRLLPYTCKAARRIGFIISKKNKGKVNHHRHHHKGSGKKGAIFFLLRMTIFSVWNHMWNHCCPVDPFFHAQFVEKWVRHKLYRMKYDNRTNTSKILNEWSSQDVSGKSSLHFEPLSYFKYAIIL